MKKAEKALPRGILFQQVKREEVDLVKDADTGKYFCSWTQLVRSSSEMRNSKVGVTGGMSAY